MQTLLNPLINNLKYATCACLKYEVFLIHFLNLTLHHRTLLVPCHSCRVHMPCSPCPLHVPLPVCCSSLAQVEQLLGGCSGFIYLGTERFLANVPPVKLVATDLSGTLPLIDSTHGVLHTAPLTHPPS